jgi:hypothetical protein
MFIKIAHKDSVTNLTENIVRVNDKDQSVNVVYKK